MHGFRGGQDKRFNSAAMLSRGLSVQERLHQSHCPDMGNLVRGHSYGGELQRINPMIRLRMGTKDFGAPAPPERTGSNLWGGGDMLVSNRLSQQHLKHRTLYGADQLLIPFNSETSLHRWKIDSYLNNSDAPVDASHEMISPHSSHTGLNDAHLNQSQLHSRSRDIKSRLEEMRQKRLSLQEYTNLRQSQESLRSMYPTLERNKFKSSLRALDIKQSVAESELDGCSLETAGNNDKELPNPKEDPNKEGEQRERLPLTRPTLTDGHRSASHYDIKTPDRKTKLTYDRNEPLSRTVSATDLETSLNDPSLKLAHLQSSGLNVHATRPMESLTEIPEEREGSNPLVNTSGRPALKNANETMSEDDKAFSNDSSGKSSTPVEMQRQGLAGGSRDSSMKVDFASGSAAPKEGKKATETTKISNTSAGSQQEAKSSTAEKEPTLQRKSSMRLKVYSMLISDERKTLKKEEKSLHRKGSVRSPNTSQPLRSDAVVKAAAPEQTTRGPSPNLSRSHNAAGSPPEPEKHRSPFQLSRLSPQQSSKRKMNVSEQEQGSRLSLDSEGTTVYQTRREKAYSRFEYFVSSENVSADKLRTDSSDKDRNSLTNNARHAGAAHGYQTYQTQSSGDNKLGRFMQRVGNLIGKNK